VKQKLEDGLSPHALADAKTWASRRPSWARAMEKLLRERGRACELLAWVFGDQGSGDPKYRIRVDSPDALRDKWDRVESAIQRSRDRSSNVGHFKVSGEEEYAGGEVQL
jgi:hypothetical protein